MGWNSSYNDRELTLQNLMRSDHSHAFMHLAEMIIYVSASVNKHHVISRMSVHNETHKLLI